MRRVEAAASQNGPKQRPASLSGKNATLRWLLRRFLKPIRTLRTQIWDLEGQERGTGEHLRIRYCGTPANMAYIRRLAFRRVLRERAHGSVWLSKAFSARQAEASNADLVMNETSWRHFLLMRPRDSYFIPLWISGDVTLESLEEQLKSCGNAKEDLRRIRKNGFSYATTKLSERFEQFYDDMYVPYVQRAYGEGAFLMSREAMRAALPKAELLTVSLENQEVAGVILLHEDGHTRGWSLGVKDGDRKYVKAGAIAALYHFSFVHLRELGRRKYHFGASRPFLNDGVLQYKRKWAMHFTGGTPRGFLLRCLTNNAGSRAFLVNNPFIYRREKDYQGMVFVDDDNDPRVPRLTKRYAMPGLQSLRVCRLDEPDAEQTPFPQNR